MKLKKLIYYSTENDEVVNFKSKPIKIDEKYKYLNSNILYKFFAWIVYRVFATPIAFIYFKFVKRIKFHNTAILKKFRKGGYFIYANHTNQYADGFCPHLICFPKKPHIICNPDNISLFIIGKFNKMCGAIPMPTTINAMKNFNLAIEKVLKQNNPIVIYPEAHLWPYYTKIRNFPATSFRFPVMFNKPVFTFTTVYIQRKPNKKARTEIYVDGPFYPPVNTTEKEKQEELKNAVYNNLVFHARKNNYEHISYIRRKD